MGPSTRNTCAAVDAACAFGNGIRVVKTNAAEVESDADERSSEDMNCKEKNYWLSQNKKLKMFDWVAHFW